MTAELVLSYLTSLGISLAAIWLATLFLTRTVRQQARRLAEQIDDQIEVNDHLIRLLEDLARIEPERAEIFEIARLDLIAWKKRQGHSAAALHATSHLDRPWRAVPQALRAWRDRRRSNRRGEGPK